MMRPVQLVVQVMTQCLEQIPPERRAGLSREEQLSLMMHILECEPEQFPQVCVRVCSCVVCWFVALRSVCTCDLQVSVCAWCVFAWPVLFVSVCVPMCALCVRVCGTGGGCYSHIHQTANKTEAGSIQTGADVVCARRTLVRSKPHCNNQAPSSHDMTPATSHTTH